MSEVTGPISTLPGAGHHLPKGTMCDLHPNRPAVARIQGETDSMGAELNDMCAECLEAERQYNRTRDRSGVCDWCKTKKPRLRNRRCSDEGLYGPVYEVCDDCCARQDKALAEELARYEAEDPWADWGDDE
jgi:hypothetical protein